MKRNEKTIKKVSILILAFFLITLILGTVFTFVNSKTKDYQEQTKITYAIKTKSGDVISYKDNKTVVANDVDTIMFNIEYYNDKDHLDEENLKVSTITNVYVNSTISSDDLAILELTVNKDTTVQKTVTNIQYDIKYSEILDTVKKQISNQGYEQIINKGIIQMVFYAGNKSDKDTLKSVVDISLFDTNLKTTISNINYTHTKSITFPLLVIIGSVVMVIGSVIALVYAYKSSKLTDFEYAKKAIFKHNKDSLVEGSISEEDLKHANPVNTFDELLKIQSIVSLPIMYDNSDETEYKFLIKVGSNIYSYKLLNK